jgi:hypothetical protein
MGGKGASGSGVVRPDLLCLQDGAPGGGPPPPPRATTQGPGRQPPAPPPPRRRRCRRRRRRRPLALLLQRPDLQVAIDGALRDVKVEVAHKHVPSNDLFRVSVEAVHDGALGKLCLGAGWRDGGHKG